MHKKIMIAMIFSILFLGGCWQDNGIDRGPVDEFTKEIKESVGDDFMFRQLKVDENGVKYYSYELMTFDAEVIKDFFDF